MNRQLERSDLPKKRSSGESLHLPVITKRGVKKFICDIHFGDEALCYLEGAKGKPTKINTLLIEDKTLKMKKETKGLSQNEALNIGVVISRFFFNERMWLKVGKDKVEPEKSVLPTILFINTNHPSFTDLRHRGFMLCVGWWDYSIKLGLFF